MEAYDSPKWSLLNQKLQRYGLLPILLKIVVRLKVRGMYSVLIVNGTQSKKIRLNRGLFEGRLLSPVLFNIFIDESTARNTSEVPYCRYYVTGCNVC